MSYQARLTETLEELREIIDEDQARSGEAEPAEVVVCRGPPRCDAEIDDDDWTPCPWCYEFRSDDDRSTEQIVSDIMRTH